MSDLGGIEQDLKKAGAQLLAISMDKPEKLRETPNCDKLGYAVSPLPGAIRVDQVEDAVQQVREGQPARAVVVYCSVGYRSADYSARLQSRGITNVFNLEGSIFQWAIEGRPLFRGTVPVQVVHPLDRKWGRLLRRGLWSFESTE